MRADPAASLTVPCPACEHDVSRSPDGWDGVGACAGCGEGLLFSTETVRVAGIVSTTRQVTLAAQDDRPAGAPVSAGLVSVSADGMPRRVAAHVAALTLLAGFLLGVTYAVAADLAWTSVSWVAVGTLVAVVVLRAVFRGWADRGR